MASNGVSLPIRSKNGGVSETHLNRADEVDDVSSRFSVLQEYFLSKEYIQKGIL